MVTLELFTVNAALEPAPKVLDTVVIIPLLALTVTAVLIAVIWVTLAVSYNACKGAAFTASGNQPSSLLGSLAPIANRFCVSVGKVVL